MKIPNLLTLSRMLLAPLWLWAFLADTPGARYAALGLALFFEVTDMVDGAVARKLEQTSQFGKILDPLADSVSRFTVFLGFLMLHYVSVWAILCIFYRDSIVSTIRILAASQGVIVSARASGKIKAIVQGIAINCILAASCFREALGFEDAWIRETFSWWVMWAVAGVTLWSLVDYLLGNRAVLAKLDA